ncbi:MAG: hypothetical protein AB7H90_04870 [Alphaproteobacteria bacterium]
MCNLISLASPIATIIAAGVAVYVTWKLGQGQLTIARRQARIANQQAQLADIRLRHDLFDRRFEVCEAARTLLLEVFKYGNVSNEDLGNFVRNTEKAAFFFDQGVADYLATLRRQAILLQEAASLLDDHHGVPVSPERTAAAHRRRELSEWFVAQFDVLLERFKPFLALDNVTASHAPPE